MTTRTLALAFAALLSAASPVVAGAADFRNAGAQAYRSGRYDPGIRAIRAELIRIGPAASPSRAEALYLLGRLELRKAELMHELARAARRHTIDHLGRLASGPTPLRRAPYFLGVARMEQGERDGATSAFRQALRVIPATATGEDLVVRQLVELRAAALGGKPVALPPSADPRVAAEAGFLLATAGRDAPRGLALAEAALVQAARRAGAPPASVVRAAAGARLAAGRIDEALALLERDEAHAAASMEKSGSLLAVHYYDVAVLRLMAEAYVKAASRDLEAALAAGGDQANLREAAAFSAARARLLGGQPKAAIELLTGLDRPATLGPAGASRVKAVVARARAASKGRAEAARLFEDALANAGSDPDVLAEVADYVADAYARGEADSKLVEAALARAGQVADGWPRRLPPQLAAGLAALTLAAGGNAATQVAQFERGRDKAAKNRLDANDPVVLARLAQAQARARLFSEALEIYFEMSKAYPEVRQVQEALQGVYAAEQVAGGEVRIN